MKSSVEKLWIKQFLSISFYKGLNILLSFLIPSIIINKIGLEKYGIWSVLLTFISWLSIVDIGFGNSLRFRLSELFVEKNYKEINQILNAAYFSFGLIVLLFGSCILFYSNYINFQALFNTTSVAEHELKSMYNISITLMLFNLWLNLINPLLYVSHKSHWISLSNFFSTFITFLIIFFIPAKSSISLIQISIFYTAPQVIASFGLSISFFLNNKNLFGLSKISLSLIRNIIKNGANFFLIQIAGLIVFSTDKFLISHFFGPKYVAKFDITLKYFSILFLFHTILSTPLWALYSETFKKRDLDWINKTLVNQIKYFFIFLFVGLVMMLISNNIFKFWINDNFYIEIELIITILIYTFIMIWNNIFATLLNGIGQEKVQLKSSIIAILTNIIFAFFFIKILHLSYISIIVSSIISSLIPAIQLPFKVKNLISTANG